MSADYKLTMAGARLCLCEERTLYSTAKIESPWDAADVLSREMKALPNEVVMVVNLDYANRPINFSLVSAGCISHSEVAVRDVFKTAILANAASIMVMHNHPSGQLSPGKPDKQLTKKIVDAGRLMDIPLMDHIIVAGISGETYSFRENNPEIFERR